MARKMLPISRALPGTERKRTRLKAPITADTGAQVAADQMTITWMTTGQQRQGGDKLLV